MSGIIFVLWLTDRKRRGCRPASRSQWLSGPRPWASSSWCCWRCWRARGRGWSAAPCARGRCRVGWGMRSRRPPRRGRRGGSRWWCRRWSVSRASEERLVVLLSKSPQTCEESTKTLLVPTTRDWVLIGHYYCIRIFIIGNMNVCLFRVTWWSINICQIRAKVLLSLIIV